MANERQHRILITGAKGFVGSHLTRLLHAGTFGDCEVIALGHSHGNGIDILDEDAVADVVRTSRPTAVVHLAAIAAPTDARRSPRRAWDVNLTGTMNIAQAILRHAPEARFVFASSSESYGASFVGAESPLDEDQPLKPRVVYAATKAAADLMIGQMALDGLRAVRFRPFNHTGPGQTSTYVVPSFAHQIAAIMSGDQPPFMLVGNLDVWRDFVDVRDIVRAYAMAATKDPKICGEDRVFNLASGRPWRIRDILDHLIAASGCAIEVVIDPERVRSNDVRFVAGNAERAAEAFGWRPEIPLERTFDDVLKDQVEACRSGASFNRDR